MTISYAEWVSHKGHLRPLEFDDKPPLKEVLRLSEIEADDEEESISSSSSKKKEKVTLAMLIRKRIALSSVDTRMSVRKARLAKFLRMYDLLGRVEDVDESFHVTKWIEKHLIAAHLRYIVGDLGNEKQELYQMIDPYEDFEGSRNLAWITYRQQGKTTIMQKFIAALMVASVQGGELVGIYSQGLTQSMAVLHGAKKYMYWLRNRPDEHGYKFTMEVCNKQEVVVVSEGVESGKHAFARSKSIVSCRGGNTAVCFFDECAFYEADFWYQFALPLLGKSDRVFTCVTTPPDATGYFQDFLKTLQEQRDKGLGSSFTVVNHALACGTCLDAGIGGECCHRLFLIPPWKSLLKIRELQKLYPRNKVDMMNKEFFGVIEEQTDTHFPPKTVRPAFDAPGVHDLATQVRLHETVWIFIDPASHMKSYMGLTARMRGKQGQHIFIGLAWVSARYCEVEQIQYIVTQFVERVRAHPFVGKCSRIIPIIECNSNEILAGSIMAVFRNPKFGPIFMPFQHSIFERSSTGGTSVKKKYSISDGIGVFTTRANKQEAVALLWQAFVEQRVFFAQELATCDKTAHDARMYTAIPASEHKESLYEQLVRTRTHEDGSIHGCTASGDGDDLAVAAYLNLYWSLSTMNVMPEAFQ